MRTLLWLRMDFEGRYDVNSVCALFERKYGVICCDYVRNMRNTVSVSVIRNTACH